MTEITGEKRLRLRKSAQPIRNPSAAYSKKCANFRTMKLPSGEPRILAKIPRIQAEGTFGIIKNDRWYKRIVRRGIKSVLLEVFLVSIGHNLYKYHNKQKKVATAA